MDCIPNEILTHVVSFLPNGSLDEMRLTCKRFRDVVDTMSPHVYDNRIARIGMTCGINADATTFVRSRILILRPTDINVEIYHQNDRCTYATVHNHNIRLDEKESLVNGLLGQSLTECLDMCTHRNRLVVYIMGKIYEDLAAQIILIASKTEFLELRSLDMSCLTRKQIDSIVCSKKISLSVNDVTLLKNEYRLFLNSFCRMGSYREMYWFMSPEKIPMGDDHLYIVSMRNNLSYVTINPARSITSNGILRVVEQLLFRSFKDEIVIVLSSTACCNGIIQMIAIAYEDVRKPKDNWILVRSAHGHFVGVYVDCSENSTYPDITISIEEAQNEQGHQLQS